MNEAFAEEVRSLMGTDFVGDIVAHWQNGDVRKVTRTEMWRERDPAGGDFTDRVLGALNALHLEEFTGSTRIAFESGVVVEVDIVAHLKTRQMGHTLLTE